MMLKQLAVGGLLILVALSASGCFLRSLLGAEVVETLSEEIDLVISALSANTTTAVCRPSEFTNMLECTYVFQDPEGFLGETTSTTQLLSEFGLFGVIVDPLVLELPEGVTTIAGTFDDGAGRSGALVIHRGLAFVPVDDARTIAASAARQLVIVDLPDGVPVDGATFQYTLTFEQQVPAGTGPTPIKALLTGKLEIGGKTFYPPMLPCTTDLSTIPPITLPRSAALVPLSVPRALPGCVNERYTYFRAPQACDLDNDLDVDRRDLDLIRAMDGATVDPGDPRDISGDGAVDADDVEFCAARCTDPGCGASGPVIVEVDFKPGGEPNAINPRSKGVIPAAILATGGFDVRAVDVPSVRFGPAGATAAGGRGHFTDVDGDGTVDLVLLFRTQDTAIACGDTSVSLTGMTLDGQAIEGRDAIRTVGCESRHGKGRHHHDGRHRDAHRRVD